MIKLLTVIFQFATSWIGRGSRIENKLDDVGNHLKEVEKDVLRVKFLQLVQHSPNEVSIICATFDEYKKLGGDSWVDDVYLHWKQKHVK